MKFEEIHTRRLILRKLTQEFFDYVHSEMTEAEQLKILGLKSNEELLKEKEKHKKGRSTHNKKFLYYQLIDKETKEIIGWCGYHIWYTDHNRAEIGYELLHENYRGQGLMSEVIALVVDYGFEHMALERIEAFVEPSNKPSIKLLKKMNFKKEGLLRHHYSHNNRMEDSIVFALLKFEYK